MCPRWNQWCRYTKGEGDSPMIHFDDTVYGGDFLANQPPVKKMCKTAPCSIDGFYRMGDVFNHTREGFLFYRLCGGTQHYRRTYRCTKTGQQILYALDEQDRRFEAEGLVTKYEKWEVVGAIIEDEGVGKGIVAQDIKTHEIKSFPSDATIIATGGPGIIFGKSTNSIINTGSAASILYQQGAKYANGEFIQIHPTASTGGYKL